jgi:hypothetical protein
LLDGPLLPRRLSMAIRRALIRYYRYYLFTIRLLLEHYLKLQRTKIAPPRKIIVPKNLDFTDPVYRKKLRLPLAKLGAFVHQYFVKITDRPLSRICKDKVDDPESAAHRKMSAPR